ncbi:MAG: PAS domain S-box protein [Candidatus Omnitrophota bacterium]
MTEKTKIFIVGAGKGGRALIELFFKSETIEIIGVVDINEDVPGMKLARELNIPTSSDYRKFINQKGLTQIFNSTGSDKVQEELVRAKPAGVEVIGGNSAKIIWEIIEEHKKTGALVINAAKEWAATFDSMPEGVSIHDLQETVLDANETICKILGKTREELIGKKCYELFHGTDAPINLCPMCKAKETENREYVEILEPRLNRWIGVSASPVFNDAGKLVKFVHIVTDISARKRSEERIKQINKMQAALLQARTPEEKFKMITDGVVNIFDADFCRIWLISKGDRCNKGCVHAVATEESHMCRYRDKCLHLVASSGRYTHIDSGVHARVPFGCYKIGGIASGEYPSFLTNDVTNDIRVHDRAWAKDLGLVSFAGIRLQRPDEAPMGVIALFSRFAISAEEYALFGNIANSVVRAVQTAVREKAISESEAKFKTIFESSKDAIMMLTVEKGFFDANASAIEMFGCKDEKQFVALAPEDLSPEFQSDGKRSLDKSREMMAIAMEKGSNSFEWIHKRVDGSEFFATVLLTRMVLQGENVLQATVRDITEIKNLEILKDQFLETVSHELRTPLTALKESISIVLDGLSGVINDEQKDFLDTAKRNVDRLVRLINELLDFQKLEAGRMLFDMRENDMNSLIEEIKDTMDPLCRQRGLTLDLKLKENLPVIKFDRDRIVQVLTNLVNNAIKFTEHGGITVSTNYRSSEDNFITVSVQDTGPGMEKKDLPRLFKRFEQLKITGTRRPGGTGLGLAISKDIIDEHGGKIWAESELEKGSTFIFLLPINERRS